MNFFSYLLSLINLCYALNSTEKKKIESFLIEDLNGALKETNRRGKLLSKLKTAPSYYSDRLLEMPRQNSDSTGLF